MQAYGLSVWTVRMRKALKVTTLLLFRSSLEAGLLRTARYETVTFSHYRRDLVHWRDGKPRTWTQARTL